MANGGVSSDPLLTCQARLTWKDTTGNHRTGDRARHERVGFAGLSEGKDLAGRRQLARFLCHSHNVSR